MKKFYYLATGIATILVTIIACEKSDIAVDEALLNKVDGLQTVQKGELSSRAEKNDICHYDEYDGWKVISISVNAVDAHMKHNDGDHFDTVLEDADGDGYYPENECGIMGGKDAFDCDDEDATKFPYSPEGNYAINRDNGAVLNITILDDGTITGSGYTKNGPSDPQNYSGTVTVYEDHTILLEVLQEPQGGTHYIEGIVSECGGITELTNDYSL